MSILCVRAGELLRSNFLKILLTLERLGVALHLRPRLLDKVRVRLTPLKDQVGGIVSMPTYRYGDSGWVLIAMGSRVPRRINAYERLQVNRQAGEGCLPASAPFCPTLIVVIPASTTPIGIFWGNDDSLAPAKSEITLSRGQTNVRRPSPRAVLCQSL